VNFRKGDCAILALRLHELTGMPLVGLFENGRDLHHVAVLVDDDVLDIDGLTQKDERAVKFRGREKQWRFVTEEEIAAQLPVWDAYDDDELNEVDDVATELAQFVVEL